MSKDGDYPSRSIGIVLVTGGSGGLAHQILQLLTARKVCKQLHSLDLRSPPNAIQDVRYHTADLTDAVALRGLFKTIQPNVVIHCASPRFDASRDILQKVNVDGTKLLVDISKEANVRAFVYTSSASVVSDGEANLLSADETYPLVTGDRQPEFYTHTKAVAESYVLSQNRPSAKSDFRTCAIRPSGIFGIGDYTVLPGLIDAYRQGRTKVHLGSNDNLFDFTENTNVAHAHHLAAAALLEDIEGVSSEDARVDGEAFFITNDEPIFFWDFARTVWRLAGDRTRPDQIWVFPRSLAMMIAGLLEFVFWIFRLGDPPLSKQKVRLSCMTRYYSIEKAKSRLAYRPLVSLKEGLPRAVKDCMERTAKPGVE